MKLLPLGLVSLALGSAACGGSAPKSTAPTTAQSDDSQPLLELVVASHSELRRATGLLSLGGAELASLLEPRLGDGPATANPPPWLSTDQPIHVALLDDSGTWAQAIYLRNEAAFEAALALDTTLTASVTAAGKVWTADTFEVAVHDQRAYFVRGGAPSARASIAVQLADDGGLNLAPEATAQSFWFSGDARAISRALYPSVSELSLLAQLATDLGRVHAVATVLADGVDWQVEVAPAAGTTIDSLLRHPCGVGFVVAIDTVALCGQLDPTLSMPIIAQLADALALPLPTQPSQYLDRNFAIGDGISVALRTQLPRDSQQALYAAAAQRGSSLDTNLAAVQEPLSQVRVRSEYYTPLYADVAGITLSLASLVPIPAIDFEALNAEAPDTDLLSDSADVPWTAEFREARDQYTRLRVKNNVQLDAVAATLRLLRARISDLKITDSATFVPTGERLRAASTWRPPGGFAVLLNPIATETQNVLNAIEVYRQARLTSHAAYEAAIHIRATDVAEWDKTH